MSNVGRYYPRQRSVTAMRVLIGVTGKDEILAFCPGANIGTGETDQRDIRWVQVPHNGSLIDEVKNDGDWIVQVAPGHWVVKSDEDFNREFVMA